MPPDSEFTTVRTSFIFWPQNRQLLLELSSTTQIFSARNTSMSLAPVRADRSGNYKTTEAGKMERLGTKPRQICDCTQSKSRCASCPDDSFNWVRPLG